MAMTVILMGRLLLGCGWRLEHTRLEFRVRRWRFTLGFKHPGTAQERPCPKLRQNAAKAIYIPL